MNFRIGLFGGAGVESEQNLEYARDLGRAVARHGLILVTGATTGIPYAGAKAAFDAGGLVIGISPACNKEEHEAVYQKPLDGCSFIVWTGSGYTGRNYLNGRNCDAAIFIGGGTGTLEEFCITDYENKIVGVIPRSGGASAAIPGIAKTLRRRSQTPIIENDDPEELLEIVLKSLNALSFKSGVLN